jgi:hypothetical protein
VERCSSENAESLVRANLVEFCDLRRGGASRHTCFGVPVMPQALAGQSCHKTFYTGWRISALRLDLALGFIQPWLGIFARLAYAQRRWMNPSSSPTSPASKGAWSLVLTYGRRKIRGISSRALSSSHPEVLHFSLINGILCTVQLATSECPEPPTNTNRGCMRRGGIMSGPLHGSGQAGSDGGTFSSVSFPRFSALPATHIPIPKFKRGTPQHHFDPSGH